MKLIENTIDADQLQSSINIDLEENMASCDLETTNQKKNDISPEKVDKLSNGVSKLSNGICNSPLKSNGFIDDSCEDDYQLMLESSSEDGESPTIKKKIYDETISAPRLVQEIEDLLGINGSNAAIDEELDKDLSILDDSEKASNVGIDEELEKDLSILDDSEKEEDNVDDNQLLNNDSVFSEEVHNISDEEEDFQDKSLSIPPNNVEIEKNCKVTKPTDETDCDSSNMNLVYDEVEIGTESVESTDIVELAVGTKNAAQSPPELEDRGVDVTPISSSTLESTANKVSTEKISEECSREPSKNTDKPDEESIITDLNNANEDDISASQSTDKSYNSEEWMVIDSIESEEEDKFSQEKSNRSEDVAHNPQSENKESNEDISANAKSTESLSSHSVSSGGLRKRCASIEEEHGDGKKPKLEECDIISNQENNCVKKSCPQPGKRLSSEPSVEDPKRSKLYDPVPVDSNISFKIPEQENSSVEKENKIDEETNKNENCVQNSTDNYDKIGLDNESTIANIEDNNVMDSVLNKAEEKVKNDIQNVSDKLIAGNEASHSETHTDESMECTELDKQHLDKGECPYLSECDGIHTNNTKAVEDIGSSSVKSDNESKHLGNVENIQKDCENCADNSKLGHEKSQLSLKENKVVEDIGSTLAKSDYESKHSIDDAETIQKKSDENYAGNSKLDHEQSQLPLNEKNVEDIGSTSAKSNDESKHLSGKPETIQKESNGNCADNSKIGHEKSQLPEKENKVGDIGSSSAKSNDEIKHLIDEAETIQKESDQKCADNSKLAIEKPQLPLKENAVGEDIGSSSAKSSVESKLNDKAKTIRNESNENCADNSKFTHEKPKLPFKENKFVDDIGSSSASSIEIKHLSDKNKENTQVSSSSNEIANKESKLQLEDPSSTGMLKVKESKLITEEEKESVKPKSTVFNNSKTPTHRGKDLTASDTDGCSMPTTSGKDELKVKLNGQLKEEKRKTLKSPFEMLSKNMAQQSESRELSKLEKSIEEVIKGRLGSSVNLPVLKKFHKSQLRRLTRTQLEETVILKICEAITDRSDIGQMRLRCQNLEQSNELWKKKAAQFEKQNRELEMVLKRFMNEVTHLKKDNQNKVVLPIKVTRSVGLQVVLASSVHGGLVSAKSKSNIESPRRETNKIPSQHQQQSQPLPALTKLPPPTKPLAPIKPLVPTKPTEKEPAEEAPKIKTNIIAAQHPNNNKNLRGRQSKFPSNPGPSSSSASLLSTPAKASPPVKPPTAKTISTPIKDLEVIDLTDREEKTKSSPPQVGGTIRVAPPTQVCFVQSSAPNATAPPMAYLVQKAGQRQQYIVATSSPSPPRPMGTINTRQPTTLALPVFRTGGQIIPVQTSSPAGLRTSTNTMVNSAARPLPQAIRVQTQQVTVLKHPAPLPSTPPQATRPGYKAPPPKPQLKIAKTVNGIMLSWSMALTRDLAEMSSYQLYAYQEGMQPPSTNLWKKVGDVKALPLPMACTLTQFIEGHRYHFAVRAVDIHGRIGPFSQPSTILLSK